MYCDSDSDSSIMRKRMTVMLMLNRFTEKWCQDDLYVYSQAKTTPELYYTSLILTVASIFSTGDIHFLENVDILCGSTHTQIPQFKGITPACVCSGFFVVRGGLWLTNRRPVTDPSRNNEQ